MYIGIEVTPRLQMYNVYTMYIGIEVTPRLFCPAFLISAVLIKSHL